MAYARGKGIVMKRVHNVLLTVSWLTMASAAYVAGQASAAPHGDRWYPLGVVILAMSMVSRLLTRSPSQARNTLVF